MVCFFFQAEDGIRDLVRSRGLGDVYKRQVKKLVFSSTATVYGDPDELPIKETAPLRATNPYLSLIHI